MRCLGKQGAVFLVAIMPALFLQGVAAASPWPAAEKQAAIEGCRMSIIVQAEQDYLRRHKFKELPAGFREQIAGRIEPYLTPCTCLFDQLEKEWSFEYFTSVQDIALLGTSTLPAQLMAGVCAVKPR